MTGRAARRPAQVGRRRFLRAAAAGLACAALPARAAERARDPLVGVQVGPFSLLDEGIERCLDALREEAAVNALFVYSHTYHMGQRPPNVLAGDHGVEVRDPAERHLPRVWVRHHPERFDGTPLGHQEIQPDHEYADRDLFRELAGPARERGMKVYARILEPSARRKEFIPGFEKVLTVDLDGAPGRGPCWNHPHYREWVYATVRDLVESYPLDGFQYGAERTGPLSYLLFRGLTPTCFCTHCVRRNAERGTDAERAKRGFRGLAGLIGRLERGGERPLDGVITNVLRVFHRYPEVLAWDYQWFRADEEIGAEVHRIAKEARPGIDSGRHVDHQRSSWDMFFRSAVSYAEMARSADFLKPILYHEILGPRLRWWVLERMKDRVLRELTLAQSLELFYAVFGHDPVRQPDLGNLEDAGLGADYVYRETRRCVEGAGGEAAVYSGIGIDVPWHLPDGMEARPSRPGEIEAAVTRAFEAGASGVLASREYDEMTRASLRVFGRAVREATEP